MLCLGGNLLRALPDRTRLEAAWPRQQLTVMISTKLNRSHLFPGKAAYILPCLSRSEVDMQASGNQYVTIEDSFSMIHGSIGKNRPAADTLQSELAIVAGIAKAATPPNPNVTWDRLDRRLFARPRSDRGDLSPRLCPFQRADERARRFLARQPSP